MQAVLTPRGCPVSKDTSRNGCPVCLAQGRAVFLLNDFGDSLIYECFRCGSRYTCSHGNDSNPKNWYGKDYVPHQPKKIRRPRIDASHPHPFGNKRLLEIGCGVGSYLQEMSLLGWDVVGVEPSEVAWKNAFPEIQSKFIRADFPRGFKEFHERFSLIALWQVLEHLEWLDESLDAIYRLLTSDGRLMLTVPNSASCSARLFGRQWIGWDVPRHRYHFTPKMLSFVLAKAGFEIEKMTTQSRSSWIRHSAKQSQGWLRSFSQGCVSRLFAYGAATAGYGDNIFVVARPSNNPRKARDNP